MEITHEEALKFHNELANRWRSGEITDEGVFEDFNQLANLWRSGEITDEDAFEDYNELANLWRSGHGEVWGEFYEYYNVELINLMSNEEDHESSTV